MRSRTKTYLVLFGSSILLLWFAPLAGPGMLHGSVGNGGSHVRPFVYDFGARLGEVYRGTFLWDTKGMAPGKYHIRGVGIERSIVRATRDSPRGCSRPSSSAG